MTRPGKIEWNADAAAHLLRRAAFGGSPEDADELAAAGMEGAVEQLLRRPHDDGPPAPATDADELAEERKLKAARKAGGEAAFRDFKKRQRQTFREIQYWWLLRMGDPRHAAAEKLALFWHGHFATSRTKVRFNHAMLVQNETLRRLGGGSFRKLCTAMVGDPAMLIWLDGRQNSAKAPNENFAREVMELFTLGEGNYSEDDVHEAARAFTGWVVRRNDGTSDFVPRRFDASDKTIFGKTGRFGAAETVEMLCSRPRCAEFLAEKLWGFYTGKTPEPDLLRSLADRYRSDQLDTGKFLRVLFTHPGFYAQDVRAAQIKGPVQWMVQASRELGRQLLPPQVALPLAAQLGQNLFMPPSVKGWDEGAAWINSATLIRRSNTARLFAVAAPPLPESIPGSLDALAWQKVAPPDARVSADALRSRLERVFLAADAAPGTRRQLSALLEKSDFPCTDDTVREAAIILLASPEYNLC